MTPTMPVAQSDLLERIREEPYRWLGHASLGCLRAFFGGYDLGRVHAGKANDLDPRLGPFSEWVAEKLGRGQLSVSGIDMIQLECEDEVRAFARYFELWDEYAQLVSETPSDAPQPMPRRESFDELLSSIRRRPGMYLGRASVTLLHAFLRGYLSALQGSDVFPEVETTLANFSDWLCGQYHLRSGYRWDRLLLLFEGSEGPALDAFFTHFAAFQAELQAAR